MRSQCAKFHEGTSSRFVYLIKCRIYESNLPICWIKNNSSQKGRNHIGVLAIDYSEKAKKMRKAEIEDAFEKFVAGKLIHLEVEGYDLWFSGEIDFEREDEDGVTNLERMLRGLGPIGPDGEVMNLHHQTHYDFETHRIKSVIVLITEYVHRTYSGGLHFGRDTYQDLPRKKVNRNEWNKVRPLFYKAIAEYFLSLFK